MERRPHVVILCYPLPGQLNPMLELAKVLNTNGFFITFIHTNYSHKRILSSGDYNVLDGTKDFMFETLPDGSSNIMDHEKPFDKADLYLSIKENCVTWLREKLVSLNNSCNSPLITCIICNFLMITYVREIVEEFGSPFVFWATSACSLLGAIHLKELIARGYLPLKDESCFTNGYLDTTIDFIPGMPNIKLKDLSSFIRTINRDDLFLNCEIDEVNHALKCSGLILNTCDELEKEVLIALNQFFPCMYTLGPLFSLGTHIISQGNNALKSMQLNLWKNDSNYKEWLNTQECNSIVYVSFGSQTKLSLHELNEFAWGLVDSKHPFIWVTRDDLIDGYDLNAWTQELIKETKGRALFVTWCNQIEVLSHSSVGAFLMHGGWNSMLDSITSGVPMLCWPGFADQYTNCHYACHNWGIGLEIDQQVNRKQVEELIREVLENDKGEEMRKNVMKWKEKANEATTPGGTSYCDLEKLIKEFESSTMCRLASPESHGNILEFHES